MNKDQILLEAMTAERNALQEQLTQLKIERALESARLTEMTERADEFRDHANSNAYNVSYFREQLLVSLAREEHLHAALLTIVEFEGSGCASQDLVMIAAKALRTMPTVG